jgi:hypothetical protein
MFKFDYKDYLISCLNTSKIILKIIIPYYFLAELMLYLDLMQSIAFVFEPISNILNLPEKSSLAIAVGLLFQLYGAIAVGASIGLNVYEWTILGLFLGVAHSLPVESAILKKLGISWRFSIIFRLGMAYIIILPMQFIPAELFFEDPNLVHTMINPITIVENASFFSFVLSTIANSLILAGEIIIVVSFALLLNQLIKSLKIVQNFEHSMSHIISLSTGTLLGITYGSAILIKEAKYLSKKQILSICCFLMIAHALIEDPLIFLIFGANIYVLIGFRLLLAVIVYVCIYYFYDKFNQSSSTR